MITGYEAQQQFTAGAEAMRKRAIEKVTAWHVAGWTKQEFVSIYEVHQLINLIAEDIQIASL